MSENAFEMFVIFSFLTLIPATSDDLRRIFAERRNSTAQSEQFSN
jgi:DNA-directed RNA polymerase subunit F